MSKQRVKVTAFEPFCVNIERLRCEQVTTYISNSYVKYSVVYNAVRTVAKNYLTCAVIITSADHKTVLTSCTPAAITCNVRYDHYVKTLQHRVDVIYNKKIIRK